MRQTTYVEQFLAVAKYTSTGRNFGVGMVSMCNVDLCFRVCVEVTQKTWNRFPDYTLETRYNS